MTSAELPAPTADAQRASDALAERLRAEIAAAGGWLDFSRYMELALYAPGLGYYSGGSTKLGPAGDFVTAPELGDWLGRALARTLAPVLAPLDAPVLLELGAGSGALAAQILDALAARGERRVRYRILEMSADLRARQQRRLERFGARVEWLERLPAQPFCGAIVANEVVDALPVSRFVIRDGRARALGVVATGAGFAWAEGPERPEIAAAVARLEEDLGERLPDGYRSELCLVLPAWITALAAVLASGSMLLVDYGLVRREYYHEQRRDGTLRCHYRHRAHDDPFVYPGLTDITAWVDWSACAAAARAAGLDVAGFTTQSQFLLEMLTAEPPPVAVDARSMSQLAALKTLLMPGEMGERFKVLMLSRHCAATLPGRDFRSRL